MWPRIRDLLQRVDLTQMRELEELFVQAVDSASRLEPEVTLSPSDQHTRRTAECRGGKAKPARMTHDDDLRPIRAQWNPHLFSYYHSQPQCCGGKLASVIPELHTHTWPRTQRSQRRRPGALELPQARCTRREVAHSQHPKIFTSTSWISHGSSRVAVRNHAG